MTEIEKDKTPSSPDPGAKRFFQNVDNLTFIDYYTVKEKVKESQSQKKRRKRGDAGMGTSDRIARFILDVLERADGTAELQRSSLADRFGCVPSQINYVIATRFSPERGYMVESRRGGGGYIRITRVQPDASQFIMHTVNAVGRELDKPTADALLHNAVNAGALEVPFARLIAAAVSERALHAVPAEIRKTVRSSIFKQMLLTTASDGFFERRSLQ